MFRRTLACALVASFLTVVGFVGPAAQAGPTTQSTTCHARLLLVLQPGLLNGPESPQQIHWSGRLRHCVGGGVTGAKVVRRINGGTANCSQGLLDTFFTLKWNTGERSKIGGEVELSTGQWDGSVVSGKCANEGVEALVRFTFLNGKCADS